MSPIWRAVNLSQVLTVKTDAQTKQIKVNESINKKWLVNLFQPILISES